MKINYLMLIVVCGLLAVGSFYTGEQQPGWASYLAGWVYTPSASKFPVEQEASVEPEVPLTPEQEAKDDADYELVEEASEVFCKEIEQVIKKFYAPDSASAQIILENHKEWSEKIHKYVEALNSDDPLLIPLINKLNACKESLRKAYAHGPWNAGKLVIESLARRKGKSPAATLQQVSDIAWYFYKLAVDKKQSFSEGAINIADTRGRLYEFLKSYPQMYSRLSSHYPAIALHFGIDIPAQATLYGLPNNKFHLLFGYDPEQKTTYIKFEAYGTKGVVPFLAHGGEYIVSKTQRTLFTGSDELAGMQKDRVPDDVSKVWVEILKNPHVKLSDADKKMASTRGVAGILEVIEKNALEQHNFASVKALAQKVVKLISTKFDNPKLRMGREVVLTEVTGL